MTGRTVPAPEFGVELVPADLHRAFEMPDQPVEVWEDAGPGGWSIYTLPGGKVGCLMETVHAGWNAAFVHAALCRAVANLTQHCPCCSAGVVLTAGPAATMAHENACPLSDDGLALAFRNPGADPSGTIPPAPRYWVVWVPRLRAGYRPRRGFAS